MMRGGFFFLGATDFNFNNNPLKEEKHGYTRVSVTRAYLGTDRTGVTYRSLQTFHPSGHPQWRDLDALLPGDFAQWQTAT
jgi:hypothetical protein